MYVQGVQITLEIFIVTRDYFPYTAWFCWFGLSLHLGEDDSSSKFNLWDISSWRLAFWNVFILWRMPPPPFNISWTCMACIKLIKVTVFLLIGETTIYWLLLSSLCHGMLMLLNKVPSSLGISLIVGQSLCDVNKNIHINQINSKT